MRYIHLSGRDLAEKLKNGMDHIHAWRVRMLAAAITPNDMREEPRDDDGCSDCGRRGRLAVSYRPAPLDRSPVLSKAEQRAIRELGVRHLRRLRHRDPDAPQWAEIGRLLQPLQDVNASFDTPSSM
ncbi:hypothetical protein AB0N16_18485 [Streptomyces sp. NPDC051105]|uniref:hypothetical protein n=1 Tax=Streptomyces sp. NPDC051105 TaxID=3154843 RepID=UPI00341468B0